MGRGQVGDIACPTCLTWHTFTQT